MSEKITKAQIEAFCKTYECLSVTQEGKLVEYWGDGKAKGYLIIEGVNQYHTGVEFEGKMKDC